MAVVTYEEQHSFLYQRVDQQLGASRPLVAVQLGVMIRRRTADATATVRPTPEAPAEDLPGIGDLRRAARSEWQGGQGRCLHLRREPGASPPAIPPKPPLSEFGSGVLLSSRSTRRPDRACATAPRRSRSATAGRLAVAVPLREVDQTLHRLLEVEVLVGGGVILALLLLGWIVIRVGLRPLERIGRVAREISHGDLARRVTPANDRTEVGRLGLALNDMLMQIEQAFADREQSEASAETVRRRRFARVAHTAGFDPRVYGGVPARRRGRSAELERAMSRTEGEVDEDGRAGRGSAAAGAAERTAGDAAGADRPAGARRARRR